MGINVAQLLRHPAVHAPDRVALVTVADGARVTTTCAELDALSRRVAAQAHVAPGARVALLADNGAAFVAAWFGVVYAGATLVPVPHGAPPAELARRVAHARCDLVLTDAAHADTARAALATLPTPPPHRRIEDVTDPDGPALARPADVAPDAAAMILYTSGTTAAPKGAVIGHASLVLHTTLLARHTVPLGPDDAILGALPLTHSYGCRMVMLLALATGARAVLVARFSASATLALAYDEGVTWIPAVPTMFAAWAAVPPDAAPAPPRLSWCLSAGAPLSAAVRARAEARLGADIREGYGMTEATFSTIDAPPDPRTPTSVGRPVPGVALRVVDARGHDLPPDHVGEVLLQGNNQMLGYLDDPAATAAIAPDGWTRSGDLGRLDAAGRLYIVDRLKDVVLRGGHTVYPSRVEAALTDHPAVAQAAAVGRPDPFYGEELVAVVVPRAGAAVDPATLRAHLAAQLADYELPRALAVVDALPLGNSRKVLKRALRAALVAGDLPTVPL